MSEAGSVAKGVGRAAGGALLFSLPIFMTMEVWQLAVAIPNHRVALLLALTLAVAILLSNYLGFRSSSPPTWRDAAVDGGVALLVGVAVATLILWLLAVVEPGKSWRDAVSIVALEALPATIGASFARSQLGEERGDPGDNESYPHELFLMAAGAVVFAANIAPTEEVILVAAKMTEVHTVVLLLVELALMHAFVYGFGFRGGSKPEEGFWSAFTHFTMVGYVIALAVSAYLLWTLGRLDDTAVLPALTEAIVLALPASLGAAAARLIL